MNPVAETAVMVNTGAADGTEGKNESQENKKPIEGKRSTL